MSQRLAKLTLTTACGFLAVLTTALEADARSDLAPIRNSADPSGPTRSHAVAGGFRRCCFRVQVEARGELSNAYDFDDGVGTHVISWRWSARELVQYEEQGGRPQLDRAQTQPGTFAPGELNLLYEERRNITDPTPESGQVGGPGEDLFDPCRYRLSTGGYRSDRGQPASSFVRLQRYTGKPRLKASRYLVVGVATPIVDDLRSNVCDALGEHTIFDLPIPLQGTWHGLQGPLTYALPPPPLTHFRQKRRIVVADRQAFAVPAAHAPPGVRHTSQASTQFTVTFTYVPGAPTASPGGAAGRCANPQTGTPRADRLTGTQGGDLLLGLGGNDVLLGLGGDDCLIGGPGRDTVDAGPGNDAVSAKDGIAETVRCGPGTDTVVADRSDRLIACERVSTG